MALPLSYNVRNVRQRWQVTLLAIFGIALVVTVFVFLTAMSSGFRLALRATGRTDNAIIVQRGSNSELTSGIDRGKASVFMVDSRIARGTDGQPQASGEILIVANLKRKADGADVNVSVRGVTQKALEVRSGIKVVQGRPLTPGLDEVIVGERAADRFGLEPRLLREDPEARLEDRRHLHRRGQRLRERDLGRPQRHGRPHAPRRRIPGGGGATRRSHRRSRPSGRRSRTIPSSRSRSPRSGSTTRRRRAGSGPRSWACPSSWRW